ncbi:PREDICTED: growth arrest and DNA damage-inducible proteins-interacting protein 1-like [Priapulus caudatus]|uniref:Large ribosomal subunit protein mL64 n=1 Tax=Priapulus caudatus TaxID=37621 RepID=A0ABM1DUV6_PRICU|nr:PREDICTED: growth arrest and DNA damage-inducible proteins-interacting protein 1-like [Priapulus caudatus]
MAAPMKSLRFCRLSQFSLFRSYYVNTVDRFYTFKKINVSDSPQRHFSTNEVQETVKSEEELSEIEEKRNISGLNDRLRSRLDHAKKMPSFLYRWQVLPGRRTRKYYRKLYASFGRDSGLNPAIGWPTSKELDGMIEHEKEWEPTLQERLNTIKQAKEEEEALYMKREAMVKENLAKMEGWKHDYLHQQQQKETAVRLAAEKKQRLMDEVQEEFGMKLDPRDERFKKLMAEKESEEKKRLKAERKKQKESRMVAKLTSIGT